MQNLIYPTICVATGINVQVSGGHRPSQWRASSTVALLSLTTLPDSTLVTRAKVKTCDSTGQFGFRICHSIFRVKIFRLASVCRSATGIYA
jgi:hypothetical protein